MRSTALRAGSVAVALIALAGCASMAVGRGPGGGSGPKNPPPGGNRGLATAEARHLLGLASLPGSRVRLGHAPAALSGPALGTPVTASLIDLSTAWRVRMPFSAAVKWVAALHPAGLTAAGSSQGGQWGKSTRAGYAWSDRPGRAWSQADLEISVAPAGANTSFWRVDAVTTALDKRPLRDIGRDALPNFDPAAGCPASDRARFTVTNSMPGLAYALLPPGSPKAALICAYGGMNKSPFGAVRDRSLGTAAAARLAALARAISLAHLDSSTVSCPMDDGSAVVIAFGYPDGTAVDLWYHDSGCSYVGNGTIRSADVTTGWATAVRRLVGK